MVVSQVKYKLRCVGEVVTRLSAKQLCASSILARTSGCFRDPPFRFGESAFFYQFFQFITYSSLFLEFDFKVNKV